VSAPERAHHDRVARPILALVALLLSGCVHAPAAEAPPPPASHATAPGVRPTEPGTAVLAVVWTNPSPRFAVACASDLFDAHQHWLRPAGAQGSLVERFMIRTGTGKIQCLVADAAELTAKWAIFDDPVRCQPRANLRLDLRVDQLPDGRLAFDAAYAAEGCEVPTPGRRFVVRRPDPPPRICCGDPRGEFRGE